MPSLGQGKRYRTLFISDVHLGTPACKAAALASFLREHEAETIFLVGDIIDLLRDPPSARWPQAQRDVIRVLLFKVQAGARVILVPGNHDAPLREFCASQWDAVGIHADYEHVTATGKTFLVTHGDQFDALMRAPQSLLWLGDRVRTGALRLTAFHRAPGSQRAGTLSNLKVALGIVDGFERAAAREAKRRGVDGVICGHIHHAADRLIGAVRYLNCGDWISSCSAVVETHAGEMMLLRWLERRPEIEPIAAKALRHASIATGAAP